jgi:hypothetical protein
METSMQLFGMNAARGDAIWDTICFMGCDGETFTTGQAQQMLQRHHGFKPKTAQLYFNYFVRYAMAHPDEFSGPKSKLVRVYSGVYRLDDNEER